MKRHLFGMTESRVVLRLIVLTICVITSLVRGDYPIMSQHYAADPTAVEWNGRLYVYCSNDEENTENSGYIMDSIVCFSTDDLKNWTDHGIVFDADQLSSWYSGTAWAPCIVHNNGTFYLYFGDAYWGIGVVTSDSPTGPFTAPNNDLVVRRGVTPGADSTWLFDPSVFVDDDGQAYLYFGGEGADQARVILLNSNMYETIGAAVPIHFPDFFEASHMHKYNGVYYYSYADNYADDYTEPAPTPGSQIAYMTSDSPTGPFTYRGVALGPPPDNYGNNNHHTFFTYQGQWYCVYHNRYQATVDGVSTTEHRNICLDRMYYNPDGSIQQIVPTQDGLSQLKTLDPFVQVEGETLFQQSGIKTEVCSEGGMNVTSISNGDWIRVRGVNFGVGAASFKARVASTTAGGSIELRLDDLGGGLVGTCAVPNTGGTQAWATVSCSVTGAAGAHDLYLRFTGSGEDELFNVNWWQFQMQPLTQVNVSIDAGTRYQTIEGLGGAVCFYNGWFTAHPFKQEIFDHAFTGLNLSMLRLGNWWRGVDDQDTATYEIVAAARQRLGADLPILMSSWSPPAYLKSNGEVGNGGTLIQVNGAYDYAGFANYWYASLQDYIAHGVTPTWIGIQNEPDWTADYDSCRFNPSEDPVNGEYFASFALAQDAVYQVLQSMSSPPKLLGPECVGLYGNAAGLRNYMAQMNPDTFYGVAHHLYGGSTDGTPDGYNSAFTTVLNSSNALFPGKPRFMTEFGDIKGLIPCANLIHNSLVVEQVSGYNHWSLMWPGDIGLVEIEFPWGAGDWVSPKGYWLNESYWSMKHYSYFVEPGFRRVKANSNNSGVLAFSCLSPDSRRLVTVLINRNETDSAAVTLDPASFAYDTSAVYQTVGEEHFASLGPIGGSQIILPAYSLTTIVLDHYGPVPPTGLSATMIVDRQVNLTWAAVPGAVSYNVKRSTASGGPYVTIAAGITTTGFCDTSVVPGVMYYYAVSSNTADGISPDSSEAMPLRMHAYLKLDETGGITASDAADHGWTGTLVNGPLWGAGKFGNAVALDGSNDHIRLPNGVVDGLTSCTISTWVNLDTVSDWSRIFDFGTGPTVNMFLTPRNSVTGTIRFAITTGGAGGEQQITGSAAFPAGAWTHVAVTLAGSTGILYVNGTETGRNTSMSLTPDSLGITTQNYIGRSQYSADACLDGRVDEFRIYASALTASDVAALYAETIPTGAPWTPSNLRATAVSSNRIDLNWNASAGATNYNIKRSTSDGGPYTLVASVSGTGFSDSALSEWTAYYYVVSAVNSDGESPDSGQAGSTTPGLPPAAPSGLTAGGVGRSVVLGWSAGSESDLAGYNVYRSTTAGSGFALLNDDLLSTPEFTDNDSSCYITYYYAVTAVDTDSLESSFSNVVSIMPTDERAVILSASDFESGFGEWVNVSGEDSHDWARNSGATVTPNTGPSGGAGASSWYVYLETSPGGANSAQNTASLQGPLVDGYNRVLMFCYHMYGGAMGTLNVDVFHDGSWHDGIWSLSGQQQASADEAYEKAIVDLSQYRGPIRIRFRAVAAGGPAGDMAIDNIEVAGRILYGDMNGDHLVDMNDFIDYAGYWLAEDCASDLNGDCLINLYEFAAFAENFLAEGR